MKVVSIGASGFAGSAILHEGLSRGHQVTAIVREPEKLSTAKLTSQGLSPLISRRDTEVRSLESGDRRPSSHTKKREQNSLFTGYKGLKRLKRTGDAQ
jgi:putative NADH-flavin reductase